MDSHSRGVDLARGVLKSGASDPRVVRLAGSVIAAQTGQLTSMQSILDGTDSGSSGRSAVQLRHRLLARRHGLPL
jgi:hypothetical protein